MPAKMMKLMPLPMPRSVMSSPIHITRMVPATRDAIMVSVSRLARSKFGMTCDTAGALAGQQDEVAVGLQQAHGHRQVAGVLVDLVAAVLAFALQLLQPGHDARS